MYQFANWQEESHDMGHTIKDGMVTRQERSPLVSNLHSRSVSLSEVYQHVIKAVQA